MEANMLHAAIEAIGIVMDPSRLMFVFFGVVLGLVLGIIPGLGGLVGLSLLLPFTFDMDPYTALAFMMGLSAVVATGDTIPAVLFGVPGTIGAAATIVDGYPMARKGEAGRALGAAFSASMIGGLFGALILGLSIPILRPVVLAVGSPELLMFCVFGLSLVAVLSGSSPLRGLAAACIGLLVATTGDDEHTGTLRWTFGILYLWDGVPIVPLALGLFAIPELADLAIARKAIAAGADGKIDAQKGQMVGIRDVMKHWFLVLRCSGMGAVLGAIPGIGGAVIDWISYGHAARTEKGADKTFGTGDVRGVIAAESSNNAKDGGALVPTVAFGVPGSASMALILGAFLIHGLVPGPDMLSKRLDVTYTLVWSVAIANVMGTAICFLFANQLAKIALVRVGVLVPVVIAVTYVGAYQGGAGWGDFYALLGFGLLGFLMKRVRWPRPPLILGFVLGPLVERYLFISVQRFGWEWLTHWLVLVMLAITIYGIMSPAIRNMMQRRGRARVPLKFTFRPEAFGPESVFAVAVLVLFIAALVISSDWPAASRLVPQIIAGFGSLFAILIVAIRLFVDPVTLAVASGKTDAVEDPNAAQKHEEGYMDISSDFSHLTTNQVFGRFATYFGWCLLFLGLAIVIGLLPAVLVYLIGYMRFVGRERWRAILPIAGGTWLFAYFMFHRLIGVTWPQSFVGQWFPELRSGIWFNLF